jgi:hypothetical protein
VRSPPAVFDGVVAHPRSGQHAHAVIEVLHVSVRLKTHEVERKHGVEQFLGPREDEEDVGGGERHVQEQSDRALVPAFA